MPNRASRKTSKRKSAARGDVRQVVVEERTEITPEKPEVVRVEPVTLARALGERVVVQKPAEPAAEKIERVVVRRRGKRAA